MKCHIQKSILSLIVITLITACFKLASAQGVDSVKLIVETIRSNDIVGGDLSMIVRIVNVDPNKTRYEISSFDINLPGDMKNFYDTPIPTKQTDLMPGRQLFYHLTFTPNKNDGFQGYLRHVFFLPKTYKISFILTYKRFIDPTSSAIFLHTAHEIAFKPPTMSIIVGGVIGALLLSLFVSIYKFKNTELDSSVFNKFKKWFTLESLRSLIIFLFGSLVSVITILVIQRTSDFALPITLKVEDYLGGIVIGMLSLKLGDSLYSFFVDTNDNKKEDKNIKAVDTSTNQ